MVVVWVSFFSPAFSFIVTRSYHLLTSAPIWSSLSQFLFLLFLVYCNLLILIIHPRSAIPAVGRRGAGSLSSRCCRLFLWSLTSFEVNEGLLGCLFEPGSNPTTARYVQLEQSGEERWSGSSIFMTICTTALPLLFFFSRSFLSFSVLFIWLPAASGRNQGRRSKTSLYSRVSSVFGNFWSSSFR